MASPQPGSKSPLSKYAINRRIASAKTHEFNLISNFTLGYRNREDITKLPPGVLVVGSQNVLTNVSGRVGARKGYVLDGQPADQGFLLQENQDFLLQEDQSLIILNN